ncbi:SDR family NAD(P)-dependent oxidoreductase [Brevibacterium yomogidense]|uniref:Putative oxidoreductase n=1 Tax=Brevibacterium yomogidense TaxID=946573 RepID=A0A1X6XJ46_9MICO|nr:SDR family NAD(P)-dependent oxidoreductase [Brevibacterium yomogidense]SLM99325.1 putative oxidoreductase [Brevibacterium yomogidense]
MTPTVVLTGGSDGIGAAAARILSTRDVNLVIVGRSAEKTRAVAAETGASFHIADFARLADVDRIAAQIAADHERIDVLANNAGGIFPGPQITEDGFEKTFQVDHLAPFLLTHRLLDPLLKCGGTVVNTASIGAKIFGRLDLEDIQTLATFTPNRAYGNAKLANILFTKGLHERFGAQGLSSVAFHPGVVATSFASDGGTLMNRLYQGAAKHLLTSPEQGGGTLTHFISGTPGAEWVSGEYYSDQLKVARTNRAAYDPEVVRRHWEIGEELLRRRDWL